MKPAVQNPGETIPRNAESVVAIFCRRDDGTQCVPIVSPLPIAIATPDYLANYLFTKNGGKHDPEISRFHLF